MTTPNEAQPELAKALELHELYFKREDLHPYGSHKGRSIPVMMEKYLNEGIKNFGISSSGNAAIAAALFAAAYNKKNTEPITLTIFIGKKINAAKLEKIKSLASEHITVNHAERPLQSLFNLTQDGTVKGLRQSNDDTALIGYESLAEELAQIPNLKAVFIPTSSGTTAQALAQSFNKLGKKIEIHVVQTMSCHPIAETFTERMHTDEVSIADAIVDHVGIRKTALSALIEESSGGGYIATNEEIGSAVSLSEKTTGISLSPNSALSLAGLMQAIYTGKKWDGAVVCLITGA